MRKQWILSAGVAVVAGALGGALVSPTPLGAVAKEIVELLADSSQLLQGQRDMQSSMDTKMSELRTLVQQQADNSNKLAGSIAAMQKTVQDLQANSQAQLNSATTGVQGLSDNLSELQGRLTKISSQLGDMQNSLQNLDSKISTMAPATASPGGVGQQPQGTSPSNPNSPPAGTAQFPPPSASNSASQDTMPPATNNLPAQQPAPTASMPSGDTLYNNALNDILTRKYDLAQQECQDYLKYYPNGAYASNAYFYLGEVARIQKHYDQAIDYYTSVVTKYPESFKFVSALYERGVCNNYLGHKSQAISDFREIIRKYPRTDEAGRAHERLKEMGVAE